MDEKFWNGLDALVRSRSIVIDRPKGSVHPKFRAAIYPVDYGYLEGTSGGDGEGIDVWRGSATENLIDSVVCTLDNQKRDAEIKILLGCTADEKRSILHFLNQGAMAAIIVRRP